MEVPSDGFHGREGRLVQGENDVRHVADGFHDIVGLVDVDVGARG
jgi:hypothetical protein